jgi:HD-GYP domain-containing protein (c-di-GMP phosphodiesterase class II)
MAPPDADLPDRDGALLTYVGVAALPAGAALLCLVGHPMLREPGGVRRLLWLQTAIVFAILAVGAIAFAFPDLVPGRADTRSAEAMALLVAAGMLFLRVGLRARHTYLLTLRLADLWVLVGIGWMAIALAASMLAAPWSYDWWVGQGVALLGMVAVGVPVAVDLLRAVPSRALAGDLDAERIVAREELRLGPHVRSLIARLDEKDAFAEGHGRRVALLAVRLGEQLGLTPGRLRRLALGALLHDIGKLRVPAAILAKPDALDDDELDIVRRHTDWGDQLAGGLGFAAHTRRMIRSHHERLDATGYPDGLRAVQLDADIRILVVCDVYDALICDRAYRPAFAPSEALELMWADAGTGYDAACLRALTAALGEGVQAPPLRLVA